MNAAIADVHHVLEDDIFPIVRNTLLSAGNTNDSYIHQLTNYVNIYGNMLVAFHKNGRHKEGKTTPEDRAVDHQIVSNIISIISLLKDNAAVL